MDKDKLKQVIAGDATGDEARQAIDWIGTDEGAAALAGLIDEDARNAGEAYIDAWAPDTPDSMSRDFYHRLYGRNALRRRVLMAAAVLIPFIIMSAVALFFASEAGVFSPTEFVEVAADKGKHMQVVLSDGTTVELNSGSRLRYPKRFALFHRDVSLDGEAYFSVVKNRMSPFKLTAGDVSVKVTGTKFNVDAYADQNFIGVMLEEGSVTLVTPKKEIAMKPQQYVSYNKQTRECSLTEISSADNQHTAWRQNILNFHMTPLGEILNVISRERNVKFIVRDPALLKSRFTLSSNNEYTAQILRDIEAVSNVNFEFVEGSGNTYLVKQKR